MNDNTRINTLIMRGMDASEARRQVIREHIRDHGGHSATEKYGRENVLAAMIPED